MSTDGTRAGTVFLYQGSPSWILVTITGAPTDGPYEMTIVGRDGTIRPAGVCHVSGGASTAGYQLYQPVSTVDSVHLIGPSGETLVADTA